MIPGDNLEGTNVGYSYTATVYVAAALAAAVWSGLTVGALALFWVEA